jgi:hypothetical protein
LNWLYVLFYKLLLHVFWCSIIRCIYVYSCYILQLHWSFYYYEVSLFASSNIFFLKSFCLILHSHSIFLVFSVCTVLLFPFFAVHLFVSLNLCISLFKNPV